MEAPFVVEVAASDVEADGTSGPIGHVMGLRLAEGTSASTYGSFLSGLESNIEGSASRTIDGQQVMVGTMSAASAGIVRLGSWLYIVATFDQTDFDAVTTAVIEANRVTATPTPTPTPQAAAPTPKPTPDPTPIPPILSQSGRGDKVVKFTPQDEPTYAKISHTGSGNFAVISYAGSEYGDLLVNEIGKYSGSVYIAPGIDRLKVQASGPWKITIRPITAAKHWDGAETLSGKGDSVIVLTDHPSGTTTVKNKSRSNFVVIVYSEFGDYLDLLVNEIGSYKGEVMLPDDDPLVLSIKAVGGTWSFSPVD